MTELDASVLAESHQGFFFQLWLLSKRNFLNFIRLPQTSYVKLLTVVVTAIFTVLLFYNTSTTPAGI